MKKLIVLAAVIILSFTSYGWSDWKTIKTDNFTIFYKAGYEKEAEESMRVLETYREKVEKITGNSMKNVAIVIEEMGDEANGFAEPIRPAIHHFTHVPGLELPNESWLELVGVHEYTHMLHMTKRGGANQAISYIWNNLLLPPNAMAPAWIIEGITVYNESQISPYQGRLNDGFYDGYIALRSSEKRAATINGAIYDTSEFPFGCYYLYGGEFMRYLAEKYGEDKFAEYYKKCGDSILTNLSPIAPFIGIDWSAAEVFGKPFPELWNEWWASEMEKHRGEKHDGIEYTDNRYIKDGLVINGKKLYYAEYEAEKTGSGMWMGTNKIMEKEIDGGEEREIVAASGRIEPKIKIAGEWIYYLVNETKPFYANATNRTFGTYLQLWRKGLKENKEELVLEDSIRGFEVIGNDVIYSRNIKGSYSTPVVRYNLDKKVKEEVLNSDYLVEEIIKGEKELYITAKKDYENLGIFKFDIDKKEITKIVDTPYIEATISINGSKIFFTGNYDKKYKGYSIDTVTGEIKKEIDSFYVQYPVYDDTNGNLYYIGITDKAKNIFVKKRDAKEYMLPTVESTKRNLVKYEELKISKGGYIDNIATLKPNTWQPLYNFNNENQRVGFKVGGGDAIYDLDSYSLAVSHDFKRREWGYDFSLGNNFFAPFHSTIGVGNLSQDGYLETEKARLYLSAEYPVWRRYNNGLTALDTGIVLNFYDDYKTREIVPYITGRVSYPRTAMGFSISAPFEKKGLGSDIDRNRYTVDGYLRQYIWRSELDLSLRYIDDRQSTEIYNRESGSDNNPYVFPYVRGYKDQYDSKNWLKGAVEYSFVPVRGKLGLWNPNVYMYDAGIKLFGEGIMKCDERFSKDKAWSSGGIEFSTEIEGLFGFVKVEPVYTISVNKDKELRRTFGIRSNF